MLISEAHVLKARVGTLIGSLFLLVWGGGAGLLVWHAANGHDPVESTLSKYLETETQLP